MLVFNVYFSKSLFFFLHLFYNMNLRNAERNSVSRPCGIIYGQRNKLRKLEKERAIITNYPDIAKEIVGRKVT